MLKAGDVVSVPFQGVTGVKQRPAVILSSALYHANRPDLILGLLTTKTQRATGPTDWILRDWQAAGLHRETAFRAFVITVPKTEVYAQIGTLSATDWKAVRGAIQAALTVLEDTPA